MPKLIAVDHGNYAIKTPNFVFMSGLLEHPVKPMILETETVEYEGKIYTLSNERIKYMRDKTRDERFFILTLFAIAKELHSMDAFEPLIEVDLAVGLPPEHYSTLRDKFAQYFKRDKVNFVHNGHPICVLIRNVFVYPQAYAAVVPRGQSLLDTPRQFVVDIGGFTTDVLLLRNGEPDLRFCRSLESGVITMCNTIIGKVNTQHDMAIDDEFVTDILMGRESSLPQNVQDTIHNAARQHSGNILDQLRELQMDLRSTPAIFIGGGSLLFRQYIEHSPLVMRVDFEGEPKANAIGYGILATSQLKRMAVKQGGCGENR